MFTILRNVCERYYLHKKKDKENLKNNNLKAYKISKELSTI